MPSGPAGLQTHTIKNHTSVHLPKPVKHFKVNVRQRPGHSYPKSVNRVRVVERTGLGAGRYLQPVGDRRECVGPDCFEACPTECPMDYSIEE